MHMMRPLIGAIALVVCFAGYACSGSYTSTVVGCLEGNGVKASEERKLTPFDAIDMDGAFEARITCGRPGQEQVRITTDKNLLDKITSDVRSGTLHLSIDGSICTKIGILVELTADQFDRLTSGGSADIQIQGFDNDALQLTVNGSGDVQAAGKTGKLHARLNGSSDIQTVDLRAKHTIVAITGSGSAEVWASEQLDAQITGAGDISYGGNPAKVTKQVMGVGDISPL